MKNAKKLASLLLALVMVLSMSANVFAATASGNGSDNSGKITINNTVKDKEYKIYCIFDLESFYDDSENSANDAYSYKVNADWTGFFTTGAKGLDYVDIDANGYVTMKKNANVADFAKYAIEFAKANNISPSVSAKTATADNAPVEFKDLPLGYYLVESSLGALCALTTTNPTATVTEKNAGPGLVKEVKEGENWVETNDANIGDTVEFKATITVQGAAIDYVVHDQMDDGLTFGSVTKVELNEQEVTAEGNYTVATNVSHTKNDTTYTDTFDVTFTEDFCNSLKSGDKIVVYYNATLNSNAVVKEAENNKAHLEYKDNNGDTHETTDSETKTYTWEIPVLKYGKGDKTKLLAGAKFTLYKTETTDDDGKKTYSNPVKFSTTDVTNTYKVDNGGTVTVITTDATGRFKLDGLDSGTYYLQETEAPAGYNKLNTVVTVTINDEGKINATGTEINGVTEIEVNNNTGSELPSTGGIGTTIFYIAGSILLIGAVVLLITKKRMSSER